VADGIVTLEEVEEAKAAWRAKLDQEFEAGQAYRPNKADWLDGAWAGLKIADHQDEQRRGRTGVALDALRAIGTRLTEVPEGFRVHRTVGRFLDNRKKMIETGEGIDWATGEA